MRLSKFKTWVAGLCVLALFGCGGGGGGGDPILGGGSGAGTTSATDLQVKLSALSVENTGTENVTATVTAVDANGKGVPGVPVTIKVDNNATYSIISNQGAMTGADGTVAADVTIGNDASIRTVTVTASAGALPAKSASFQVVGSRQLASDLTLAAPTEIQNSLSNSVTVTVTAVDANRNALAGIPVTLAVDAGATLVPSGTQTNASGIVTGVVRIGADQSNRQIKVTAISGGLERKAIIEVRGSKLTASGLATVVAAGSLNNRITYLLVDNTGAKMAGYPISIKLGEGSTVSSTTNSFGEYVFTYDAPRTAQSLVIEARSGGAVLSETVAVQATAVIDPVSIDINSASVEASPNVVPVNPAGVAATNKVEVRALFIGVDNKPVKNVRVWFDRDGDKQSIGGTLDSSTSGLLYSDANGIARTTFTPGARFSPKDGVTIRACWSKSDFIPPVDGGSCANAVRTTLTVNSESLSVSIGTNATIQTGASGLTYVKRYAVQVVDSSGQAKAGVQIAPSVDLLTYYKGRWVVEGDKWVQMLAPATYPVTYPLAPGEQAPKRVPDEVVALAMNRSATAGCDNEDLNRNGVSEVFQDTYEVVTAMVDGLPQEIGVLIPEDQNGSGDLLPVRPRLDPRKADVTVALEGGSLTNADGVVVLKIEYPQNIASWVRFNILVSASGVAGTEGRANFDGVLPVLAVAVNTVNADPPFKISPYGVQSSPAYLRKNLAGQSGWLCTNPN